MVLQVLSVHNLQMHSGIFTKILMDDRLLDALQDVMGTENIALHHTKAHIKPPQKGAPYLMHQVTQTLFQRIPQLIIPSANLR